MLIILSNINDVLATDVLYWLRSKCIRINKPILSEDIRIESIYHGQNDHGFEMKVDGIDLSSIKKIWFRRGDISLRMLDGVSAIFKKTGFNEINALKRYLIEKIDQNFVFNSYSDEKAHSKIRSLELALSSGFLIPPTLITGRKSDVVTFHTKYGALICKAIGGAVQRIESGSLTASIGTFEVSDSDIDRLSDDFFPTLFQQKIEKLYEIRVFFIGTGIFPMAIISGKGNKSIDYRDHYGTNRNVPYKLPTEIEEQLLDFIGKSQLFSGSVDLIYSVTKEYYFLEVNPTGQFGWVSKHCNYYLEKKIASVIDNKL